MSNSSDSEAFESADEDLVNTDDEQPTTVIKTKETSAKTAAKVAPSSSAPSTIIISKIPDKKYDTFDKDCGNTTEETKSNKEFSGNNIDVSCPSENVVKVIEHDKPNVKSQPSTTLDCAAKEIVIKEAKSDEQFSDVSSENETVVADVMSQVPLASVAPPVNNSAGESCATNVAFDVDKNPLVSIGQIEAPVDDLIATKNTEKVTDEPADDGWEFDDWGGDDADENNQQQQQQKVIKKAPPVAAVAAAIDDDQEEEVGWEIDDWDDVSAPPINAAAKGNNNDFFPVLEDLSPKKQPSKSASGSGGFLGNLSKLIISDELPTTFPLNRQQTAAGAQESAPQQQGNNWGWKPWGGVVSLLSTASDGMATITSNVSSLIESGIGAPDPMELARQQKRDAAIVPETAAAEQITPVAEFGGDATAEKVVSRKTDEKSLNLVSFVSGVTQIGNRVIAGGLDTLEGIGKKTMNILQENDPGLLNKRKMLMMDKNGPALSQV